MATIYQGWDANFGDDSIKTIITNYRPKIEQKIYEALGLKYDPVNLDPNISIDVKLTQGPSIYSSEFYKGCGMWEFLVTDKKNLLKKYAQQFFLSGFPGCCGLAIAYSLRVVHPFNNHGLGTLFNQMQLDLAKAAGFGACLATDKIQDNEFYYSQKLLKKNGWNTLTRFKNPRTKNNVDIFMINLSKRVK